MGHLQSEFFQNYLQWKSLATLWNNLNEPKNALTFEMHLLGAHVQNGQMIQ